MRLSFIIACVLFGSSFFMPLHAEEKKKLASSQPFTLICTTQGVRKVIAVDLGRRTVDGQPASFSEASITWKTGDVVSASKKAGTQTGSNIAVNHELNRLDGSYRRWNEGDAEDNSITYGCEKATAQRF